MKVLYYKHVTNILKRKFPQTSSKLGVIDTKEAIIIIINTSMNANPQLKPILPE